MLVETKYPHIVVDEKGSLRVEGTGLKVKIVPTELQAGGLSPEALLEQYPELTLAKIHSALAFYYDHKAEIGRQIAESLVQADALREESLKQPSPVRERIKVRGRT